MTDSPNRIRELRRQRNMTLQQLAESIGTSKSQIDKLEKGARRLTVEWMVRLSKPLCCNPGDLMGGISGFEIINFGSSSSFTRPESSLPVKSASESAKNKEIIITDEIIDRVPRPYYLSHAKDAYAIYMVGDSMSPMYRPRQLLFINPHKPPTPGCGVILTQTDGRVFINEFIKQKPTGVILREHRPKPRDFTIPQTAISTIHAIVGATEPA
ncbi:MAG: LexA family transcriptional regulator [Alphaproteobacteria bacterium]|nr:LexA family transcriptional regulator [Alphaproteobacteria bacterium]